MSESAGGISPMIKNIRTDFIKGTLSEDEVDRDPMLQFQNWLDFTMKSGNDYGNAMVLSTVDDSGMPSSRVMLLRDISHGGFTFFTNYNSRKGREISGNNKASLVFFWPEHERQVRVQGTLTLLPGAESDEYFQSRPFESRVGALVSKQSEVIQGRLKLDEEFERRLKEFNNKVVPRPVNWGGYLLEPVSVEFWQGRANRLHDRVRYRKEKGQWVIERLMP